MRLVFGDFGEENSSQSWRALTDSVAVTSNDVGIYNSNVLVLEHGEVVSCLFDIEVYVWFTLLFLLLQKLSFSMYMNYRVPGSGFWQKLLIHRFVLPQFVLLMGNYF